MAKNSDVYFPPTEPTRSSKSVTAKSGTASQPPVAAPYAPTNVMALIGFILSVSGFFLFISAIPGVVLGHIALKQIRDTGEAGRGMAIAALAVGYSVIALGILTLFVVIAVILVPFIVLGTASFSYF
ncbi:unannotated protein [freshwater metagenome]|jgi:hypothetical protein|uniref:Unannotated protein n=1 Tax=freshwater metagenome TaxID=449393 RepID=A0A6J6CW04_9ZZZZ|nr:DUF4190 domain-containing protein [Actinomycetota bacterium]